MTAYPPPPPAAPQPAVPAAGKTPPIAWLVPLAGLLGLLGAVLTWFTPVGTVDGQEALKGDNLHSWDDGKIGLVGPILLVVAGVLVVLMLLGKTSARIANSSSHEFVAAGRYALIAGGIAIVCTIIAWFMLPSQYKVPGPNGEKLSWDDAIKLAKEQGFNLDISRGPQIGFWLTIVGAVIALAGGALLMLAGKKAVAATPTVPPAPPVAQPPYGAPAQQYGAPAPQYGAPAQQYGAPAQQYGAPAPQYGAPAQPYAPPAQPPSLEK